MVDGLAIVPVMIAAACFALITYLVGNVLFSGYLQLYHVVGSGELAVFCGSIIGAGLGFFGSTRRPQWFYGRYRIFVTGRGIGTISVITKHELVLAIMVVCSC